MNPPAKQAADTCGSCFKTAEVEPVLIRHSREEGWVESTIRRCANPECHTVRSGSMEDRLTHVRNVYDYKYFGDYELSPEQLDAVWEAHAFAMRVPALVAALKAAEQFIKNGVEFGFIRMPETETDPANQTLPAIQAALASHGGDHG